MPLEESSPLMFLILISLICIFHPSPSNSYSFMDMSRFGSSDMGHVLPQCPPLLARSGEVDGPLACDQLKFSSCDNATRMRTYVCTLFLEDKENALLPFRHLDGTIPGNPGHGIHESAADSSCPEKPSDLNRKPLPLYSWLLGASIFGLMGFSRKPC
jgi:hypothetical protein